MVCPSSGLDKKTLIMTDNPEVSNFIRPSGRPPGRPSPVELALPRRTTPSIRATTRPETRSPFAVVDGSQETRRQIAEVVEMIRAADATGGTNHSDELKRSLEEFEARLGEREQTLDEREFKLAERQRELAENEALLEAREEVLVARSKLKHPRPALSQEEKAAIKRLKEELDRQEALLLEGKEASRVREAFLEQSEAKLFEKVQDHQEKETELEQREEELKSREQGLRVRESRIDPAMAAMLQAEAAPRRFDEFNE